MRADGAQKETARPLRGAPFFSSEAQSHSSRGPKRSNAANAAQKNPGASPGKRYVIQRIGAFGQLKPCERQRHDAVAYGNAGAAMKLGRRKRCPKQALGSVDPGSDSGPGSSPET